MAAPRVERVVFAGGGNRCFWQAGFWQTVAPVLQLRPEGVAAVSAGAAVACALFAGTFERGFAGHKQAVQDNPRNLHARNLLRSGPLFPHAAMYRAAILASINAAALERLKQGPDIRIVAARPPTWARRRMAILLGAVSLAMDTIRSGDIGAAAALRMGFRPVHLSVRDCRTPEELADLILASSCVPPLVPLMHIAGSAVLDGGLVGSVPLHTGGRGGETTLVLLTRRFARLPVQAGYTWVQPSRPVPVGTWDYTNGAALQAAYELGQSDGEAFLASAGAHRNRPYAGRLPLAAIESGQGPAGR